MYFPEQTNEKKISEERGGKDKMLSIFKNEVNCAKYCYCHLMKYPFQNSHSVWAGIQGIWLVIRQGFPQAAQILP